MKQNERDIIHKCATALISLPGKNNGMSGAGAAQYHDDIKAAIGLNYKVMLYLTDGAYLEAERNANDLVALVFRVLLAEGLGVTAAMAALKGE